MKSKIQIKAIIPCRPKIDDDPIQDELFKISVDEINSIFENNSFDIDILRNKKINFQICQNNDIKRYLLYFWNIPQDKTPAYLIFSSSFEIEIKNNEVTKIDNRNLYDNEIHDELELKLLICIGLSNLIYEIVFYANLARPGSLGISEGIIFCDDKYYERTNAIIPFLNFEYAYSAKCMYPKFENFTINEIKQKFTENHISLLTNSHDSLSKAINCLTYVFCPDSSESEKFIYCLMGLEAIYTKGIVNISEQLDEKIQIFLGPLIEFKKSIKEMYSFRSRFLHGDLPINPRFYDSDKDVIGYEILDNLLLANRILLATVQKMLKENRTRLEFKHILK